MKQQFELYTQQDKEVWKLLFTRQLNNLQDKASYDYLQALKLMYPVLQAEELPNFELINAWFSSRTGWQIACVPGLIDVDEFFKLLADKKFPSSTWLRSLDKLDYLEEPDLFHDIFGHIPLLANPIYSDFMHAFGILGCQFLDKPIILSELQRLYWFTIEFGLIQEGKQLSIYGAGIVSSYLESITSVRDEKVVRKPYLLSEVIQTEFCTTEPQNTYFVLSDLQELFTSIQELSKTYVHEMECNSQPA